MTDNTIRVVAAVASKTQVVLYKEDGKTLILQQGDHRLAALLEEILPITNRGEVAVISLETFSVYKNLEKKSNGLIRMFKMAKKAVVEFFADPKPEPEPVKEEPYRGLGPEEGFPARVEPEKGVEIVEKPVSKPLPVMEKITENDEVQLSVHETLVAVVDGVLIPGIEKIQPLIIHAVKTNSEIAVHNFLIRIAAMIDKRRHSVEDILRFLERGDLPLAKDGSIIAYKILKNHKTKPDTYVDCHSGKVTQKVGSYVCVREDLVDLSRDAECSNGLHIARRGYLGQFAGDVCMLCKIDPEDIMTVPHRDPNKVRVKGYHILALLPDEAFQILKSNRPMTSEIAALKLVFDAIEGHHINRIEQVQINGQMGNDIIITKLGNAKKSETSSRNYSSAAAVDDEANRPGMVDPRDLNRRIQEEDEANAKAPVEVSQEVADELEEELREIELDEETDEQSMRRMADDLTASSKSAAEREEQMDPTPVPEEVKPAKVEAPKEPKSGTKTKQAEAREFYEAWMNAKGNGANHYIQLVAFKKRVKKGWEALGFNQEEIELIQEFQGKY